MGDRYGVPCWSIIARELTYTLVVAASEELNPHDWEDEPEDKADKQHVEDGGYSLDQSVYHHLKKAKRHAVRKSTWKRSLDTKYAQLADYLRELRCISCELKRKTGWSLCTSLTAKQVKQILTVRRDKTKRARLFVRNRNGRKEKSSSPLFLKEETKTHIHQQAITGLHISDSNTLLTRNRFLLKDHQSLIAFDFWNHWTKNGDDKEDI